MLDKDSSLVYNTTMRYHTVEKAAELSGFHPNTIRRWADDGTIPSFRTKGGHRRVCIDDYTKEPNAAPAEERVTICYCRVSSPKQRDDLARQVEYMRERYPDAEIVRDIGSGINFKRKGLRAILERAMRGTIVTLVVAYRDRLARFGSEIIEFVVRNSGGELVVLNEVSLSPEQELSTDLLTILHVFSCRLHGLRKYRTQIEKDTDISGLQAKVDS